MFAILGATGKAGGATDRALRQRGLPVRAIVRDPTKAADLAAMGCEIAIADLRDGAALAKAIAGAQAVQVIVPINPKAEDMALEMRAMIDTIAAVLVAARPPECSRFRTMARSATREPASPSPSIISRRNCARRQRSSRCFDRPSICRTGRACSNRRRDRHPAQPASSPDQAVSDGLGAATSALSPPISWLSEEAGSAAPRLCRRAAALYAAGCRQDAERRIRPRNRRARTAAGGLDRRR